MTRKPLLLISACLCGQVCRYDAVKLEFPYFASLAASGVALPICPEIQGGLPTPRPPFELVKRLAFTRAGADVTEACKLGACKVLETAMRHNIRVAILKDRSPSCGTTRIFDGSFSGRLIPGMGLLAEILRQNDFTLYSEHNAPEYF